MSDVPVLIFQLPQLETPIERNIRNGRAFREFICYGVF
ncbi:hypothetical protein EV06_2021 [Prochlorococcus sp. MIT 0602]|nr:hypothetical protein EV06_2021 [Prochlorococcus sp. MIT 0602]KGG15613.1 hypothetical protein EV07_1578 [Prochlorococcus sp. MIT 0603]